MSVTTYDSALAPIGLREMISAFVASARSLHATRDVSTAVSGKTFRTRGEHISDEAELGRLDFAAVRASSFRR